MVLRCKVKAPHFIFTFIVSRPTAAEVYHRITNVDLMERDERSGDHKKSLGFVPGSSCQQLMRYFSLDRPTERVNSRPINKASLYFVAFIKYKVQVQSLWQKKEG